MRRWSPDHLLRLLAAVQKPFARRFSSRVWWELSNKWASSCIAATVKHSPATGTGAASRGKEWDHLRHCMARLLVPFVLKRSASKQYLPLTTFFLWEMAGFEKTTP